MIEPALGCSPRHLAKEPFARVVTGIVCMVLIANLQYGWTLKMLKATWMPVTSQLLAVFMLAVRWVPAQPVIPWHSTRVVALLRFQDPQPEGAMTARGPIMAAEPGCAKAFESERQVHALQRVITPRRPEGGRPARRCASVR